MKNLFTQGLVPHIDSRNLVKSFQGCFFSSSSTHQKFDRFCWLDLCAHNFQVNACTNMKHYNKQHLFLFGEHKRRLTTWLDFPSSRETISRLGIEPPTTPFDSSTSPLSSSNLWSSLTITIYNIMHCLGEFPSSQPKCKEWIFFQITLFKVIFASGWGYHWFVVTCIQSHLGICFPNARMGYSALVSKPQHLLT